LLPLRHAEEKGMLNLLDEVKIWFAVERGMYEFQKEQIKYKLVTRKAIKQEVKEQLANQNDILEKAIAAKVAEKEANNEVITLDILDKWDTPLTQVDVIGEQISNDIHVGDVIPLWNEDQ